MDLLYDTTGYDAQLIARLRVGDRMPFVYASCLSLFSSGLGATSMSYATALATESLVASLVVGAVSFVFVLNLTRLMNAGGGRPIQGDKDDISVWRPSLWPPFVLFVFGTLFCHGGALLSALFLGLPGVHMGRGLIAMGTAAWRSPGVMAGLCIVWGLLFAGFSIVRFFGLRGVRAYERERWRDGRALVDVAFNKTNLGVVESLSRLDAFSGELTFFFTNPPYNTHRMLFGIDEGRVERRGIRFIAPSKRAEPLPPTPRS